MPPKPRPETFDTYWRFAAERQRVFYRRLAGEPAPWSEDPILRRYKFCNAYRASDRASQFLIRRVIYAPHLSTEPGDVVLRVLLFRLFNRSETWSYLEEEVGEPGVQSFDVRRFGRAMDKRLGAGGKLFGAAFILCANKAFGFDRKHDNYLALIRHMLDDDIVRKVQDADSFEALYLLLLGYPLLGKFMAYQIATDLNYSEVVDFDENSFTKAGPGAVRGIAKCFEDTAGYKKEEVIHWMVEHQEEHFRRLGFDLESVWLWGRPLKAIDCQNLFCETDKYCRVAFPEIKSNRKRIKVTFRATRKPVDYFYPPKWGLNERLQQLPELPSLHRPERVEAAGESAAAQERPRPARGRGRPRKARPSGRQLDLLPA